MSSARRHQRSKPRHQRAASSDSAPRQERASSSSERAAAQVIAFPAAETPTDAKEQMTALGTSLERVLERAYQGAKGLARSKDRIDAEATASTLMGIWSEYELPGQADPAALLAQALVGYLEDQATTDAIALLHGLAAVELHLFVDANMAIGRLEDRGVAPPKWGGRRVPLQHPRLESAWLATDVFGDHDFLVGRYTYGGDAPHDLSVLVDHNILDIAKDVGIIRANAGLRRRWEDAPDIEVRDLSAQEYSDRMADAFENLDRTWEPPIEDGARWLGRLARARLMYLPRARRLKRREVSEAARKRAYKAFRASTPGSALGRDADLARMAIDYAADYYVDILRWSPIVVELFLTDWLPRKISLGDEEIERLPSVLRAWLRFVGEQRGFADRLVQEMLDAVDGFEPVFRTAMRDEEQFGPAKSIVGQMQAQGVDLTDQDAIQAWMEEFNARPHEERLRLTGKLPR